MPLDIPTIEALAASALADFNELDGRGRGDSATAQRRLRAAHYWLDLANRREGFGDGSEAHRPAPTSPKISRAMRRAGAMLISAEVVFSAENAVGEQSDYWLDVEEHVEALAGGGGSWLHLVAGELAEHDEWPSEIGTWLASAWQSPRAAMVGQVEAAIIAMLSERRRRRLLSWCREAEDVDVVAGDGLAHELERLGLVARLPKPRGGGARWSVDQAVRGALLHRGEVWLRARARAEG